MTSVTSAAAMKLLDVRLKHAGSIIASAIGEFTSSCGGNPGSSSPPTQEIACLRAGGTIDVYRIVVSAPPASASASGKRPTGGDADDDDVDDDDDDEESTTTLRLVSRVETRSTLRCLSALRVSGSKRDVLVVGSDSGCFSVLDFEKCGGDDDEHGDVAPKILHCPTFGKPGIRRDTPGQYLCVDPRGRACMVASIEKRKLVYVVHRDATGSVTLASPLEAHRPRTLVHDVVGVDNGYDNPIFACLEVQYEDHEDAVLNAASPSSGGGDAVPIGRHGDGYVKQLAYYELDLGLNHVSRRWATAVHRTACCLAAVPGGAD